MPVEAVHAVREDLNLSRPYVLFVGTIEPRKNLDRLLDAWLGMHPDLRAEFELVIAGPVGWAPETAKRLSAGASGARTLGYVPEAFLPALTAGRCCSPILRCTKASAFRRRRRWRRACQY